MNTKEHDNNGSGCAWGMIALAVAALTLVAVTLGII